jgi:hypothetical protein
MFQVSVKHLCAPQIWLVDTQVENKEYKVIQVEEDTVLVEIRGLDHDGAEA